MAKVSLLALLALAALPARADEPPPSPLEFPLFDDQLASQARARLQAYTAARALAEAPDAPETISALLSVRRWPDAVRVLHAIVDGHPDRMADALERFFQQSTFVTDKAAAQALAGELPAARRRLPELSRDAAAEAEWALTILEALVPTPKPADKGALEKLGRSSPGTALAAAAVYRKGVELTQAPSATDPTPRFLQLIDVVAELESGRYPPCEWVRKAPQLVADFHSVQPSYAPGSADKMLAAYERFVATHLGADADDAMRARVEWILEGHMVPLYEIAGRENGLDAFLGKLRPAAGAAYVDDVRARLALKAAFAARPPERGVLMARARARFAALADQPAGTYPRRALANLAAIDFFEGDCARALPSLSRYLELYPHGAWAWVAALRQCRCLEKAGDAEHALLGYVDVATSYAADGPAPIVLGHALAAEAAAGLGRAAQALAEDRLALAAFTGTDGYVLAGPRDVSLTARVEEERLRARIAELERTTALPGGDLLEKARWLAEHHREDEAEQAFDELLRRFPRSSLAAEARLGKHRILLEQALADGADESPLRDAKTALKKLEALGREPFDFAVWAADFGRASLLSLEGAKDAQDVMEKALGRWASRPARKPANDLERDVTAIRDVVFRPLGDGIFVGRGQWNGFAFPISLPPFVVAPAELRVRLPDGHPAPVAVGRHLPGIDRALFFDPIELAILQKMLTTLGGSRTRPWHDPTTQPNQPAGASVALIQFWNAFFPARAGHWGGWVLDTYPIIDEVAFTDAARTRAEVKVTIGYAGCTVVLERQRGVWKAIELTHFWIT